MEQCPIYRALFVSLDITLGITPHRNAHIQLRLPETINHALEQSRLKKTTLAIGALTIGIIASNVWWATKVLDGGISYTYLKASNDTATEQLNQTMAVLNSLTKENASKQDIVAAARGGASDTTEYEKLGYLWVGQIGLKFNESGRLIKVVTNESDAQ